MYATQVLPEDPLEDDPEEDNNSEVVGFIVVDDKKHEIRKGETKIGRESSMCSIVIENFTISKVHAVIESEGKDDTFIYDCGSTNQTKLGKKILKPHCRYKLEDCSKITLGNVIVKFVIPDDKSLDNNFTSDKPTSVNFDVLDELGDIFDLPTQVSVVHPNTSSKLSELEKPPESFHIFKIPKSVPPKSDTEPTRSYLDKEMQCKLHSQETKSKVIYSSGSQECSGIFSLDTQCQLYDPSARQDNNCEVKIVISSNDKQKSVASDKFKSLLHDGEDDMLCVFMSHEESNNKLLKNIKTENSYEVLSGETSPQIEAEKEVNKEFEEEEVNKEFEKKTPTDAVQNKLSQEFSPYIKNPSITSTPINHLPIRSGCFDKTDTSTHFEEEEDFINTQEFNANGLQLKNHSKNASLTELNVQSQNRQETQPFLGDSMDEQMNDDEDVIVTQSFEVLEKENENKEATAVILESEELNTSKDSCETEIFPVEKPKGLPQSIALQSRDSTPDRDFDTVLNFTQRNDEDDLISTQVFQEKSGGIIRETDGNSNRSEGSDDEDFIATQAVQPGIRRALNNTNCQDAVILSQEGSPDLLVSESSLKTYEDNISTQIFEGPDCRNFSKTPSEISSSFSGRINKEFGCSNNFQAKSHETLKSSGDETDSDLEILLDKSEAPKKDWESSLKPVKFEPEAFKSISQTYNSTPQDNDDSNGSYIFDVEPKSNSEEVPRANVAQGSRPSASDTDETYCEEIAVFSPKMLLKEERMGNTEFEEKDNFEGKKSSELSGAERPKFEVGMEDRWSPLSLEMPSTQDVEATIRRVSRKESEKSAQEEVPFKMKKIEVGIKIEPSVRQTESPLKRPRESNNTEVIPSKKSKTQSVDKLLKTREAQFSKFVKAHDIAQIQPSRTRNSLRNLSTDSKTENNSSNESPNSRRKTNPRRGSIKKINGDISSYLIKKVKRRSPGGKQKKETSPDKNSIECSARVLRSSTRNSGNASTPNNSTNSRLSLRNSTVKNGDYFVKPNVAFTGFDCEALEKIIFDLGGSKTNDLKLAKVVVADKVRRTVKFLCAVGLSLPITSPQWLLTCKKEKKFVSPWNFILKDEVAEERWDFKLKTSLWKSKNTKLLEGFNIFATKSTKPPVKDLLEIVECCGGKPLYDVPSIWPRKTIFVSCLDDKKMWPPEKCRNVKIVHYEFILSGVLRQKIDFKTYTLR